MLCSLINNAEAAKTPLLSSPASISTTPSPRFFAMFFNKVPAGRIFEKTSSNSSSLTITLTVDFITLRSTSAAIANAEYLSLNRRSKSSCQDLLSDQVQSFS